MNPELKLQEAMPSVLSGTPLLGDPFSSTAAGHFYYAGGDGAQRLDLLLHLAPYSPLLVIAGKPGSGKTALLHQFMSRAHDSWRLALVTARVDMGRDELLRDMARGFGLTLDPRIDHQQLYAVLVDQLRALRQNAQVPILLLDDAQYLSATMMELVLKLCTENDNGHILSILLFGTPQLQNLLDSPALTSLVARVTHTFEVTPLDEEETGAYIRHRMRAAGAEDDGPFNAVTINKIYAVSGGIPARINEAARRVLDAETPGEPPRRVKRPTGAGAGKRLVAISLAVVVGMLMVAGPLRTALFKEQAPLTKASVSPAGEARVMRTPPEAPPGDEAIPLPLPPLAETSPEPVVPGPDNSAPPAAAAPEPPAAVSPAPPAEPPAAKPAPPPPLKAVPAPVPPSKPAPPAEGEVQGTDWVRAQPDDHFTLQLMAVREEDAARQFITLHRLQGEADYILVQRDGRTLYAVLYGSYPSRIEAARAAKALPRDWGVPNPWIRSFKGVHRDAGR